MFPTHRWVQGTLEAEIRRECYSHSETSESGTEQSLERRAGKSADNVHRAERSVWAGRGKAGSSRAHCVPGLSLEEPSLSAPRLLALKHGPITLSAFAGTPDFPEVLVFFQLLGGSRSEGRVGSGEGKQGPRVGEVRVRGQGWIRIETKDEVKGRVTVFGSGNFWSLVYPISSWNSGF